MNLAPMLASGLLDNFWVVLGGKILLATGVILGVSLVIIGLFFIEARALPAAALTILAGTALMVAEYRSHTL